MRPAMDNFLSETWFVHKNICPRRIIGSSKAAWVIVANPAARVLSMGIMLNKMRASRVIISNNPIPPGAAGKELPILAADVITVIAIRS